MHAHTYLDFRHGDRDVPGLNTQLHAHALVRGKPLGLLCTQAAVLTRTTAERQREREMKGVERDRERERERERRER